MVGTAFSLPERAASERGCVGGCGLGQGSLEPSTEYYSQFRSSLLGSAPGAYRADKGQASMALLAPPSSQAPAKDSGRIKPRAASLGWIQGSCRFGKSAPAAVLARRHAPAIRGPSCRVLAPAVSVLGGRAPKSESTSAIFTRTGTPPGAKVLTGRHARGHKLARSRAVARSASGRPPYLLGWQRVRGGAHERHHPDISRRCQAVLS